MWLNENLIKFIESSAAISKTTIYISDLRRIRLLAEPTKASLQLDRLVSRELLESLLVIGTGLEQDRYIMINSKNSTIPLIEEIDETDENTDNNFVSQIILPLWVDNELKGSLVLTSEKRQLDDYDLELAKSIQIFIEESIINSINEEFLKKTEKKKLKTTLLKKEPKTISKPKSAEPIEPLDPLEETAI